MAVAFKFKLKRLIAHKQKKVRPVIVRKVDLQTLHLKYHLNIPLCRGLDLLISYNQFFKSESDNNIVSTFKLGNKLEWHEMTK